MANNPDPRKKKPTPPPIVPEATDDDVFAELISDDDALDSPPASGSSEHFGSEVNLGGSGARQKTPSGESSELWADLVKDPSTGGTEPSAKFDSPSDAPVVQRAASQDEDILELLDDDEDAIGGAIPIPGVESSRVDLFDAEPDEDPLRSRAYPQLTEGGPASGLDLPSAFDKSESGVSLIGKGASGVNLIGEPIESGVNFAEPIAEIVPDETPSASGLDLGSASVIEIESPSSSAASGLDLSKPDATILPDGPPSGRGESGVDLGAPLIEEVEEPGSSAISLGSSSALGAELIDSGNIGEVGAAGAVLLDSSSSLNLDGAVVLEDEFPAAHPLTVGSTPKPSSDSEIYVGADAGDVGTAGAILLESPSSMEMTGAAVIEEDEAGTELLDLGAMPSAGNGGSAVNLDFFEKTSDKGSSRDLIAEAVESGVDLASAAEDDDDAAVILSGEELPKDESSAVNLGASVVIEDETPANGASGLLLEMYAEPEAEAQEVIEEAAEEVIEEAVVEDDDMAGAALIDDDEEGTIADMVMADEGEPSGGSGNVELGGAMVLADDSAEGTLEDDEAQAMVVGDDFLGAMDDVLGVKPKTKVKAPPVGDNGEIGLAEEEFGEALDASLDDSEGEVVSTEEEGETAVAIEDDDGETMAAVASEDDEEEEPARPMPKPKYGRRWLGGTIIGTVLGAAACVGLIIYDPEIPKQVRELVGVDEPTNNPGTKPGVKPPPGQQQQVATIADLLKNSDFSREVPAINEQNGDDRARRGEYLWVQYLNRTKDQKFEDDQVKKALDDLKKADQQGTTPESAANALYWQGHIYEHFKNRDEAVKIYKAAADRFKADPKVKERFDGALDRLDVLSPVKAAPPPAPGAGARLDYFPLSLGLVPAQQPPPPGAEPEAGFDFWKAMKLAGQQKYAEAAAALAEARKKHDARRLQQIRKPQNPISDPKEDIFLKACDELTSFWLLQDKLRGGGYLAADKTDPGKALDDVFADLKKARDDGMTIKKDFDKLADDKKKADESIKTLMADLDKSKKDFADSGIKIKMLEDTIKAEQAKVIAEMDKVKAGLARIARLESDKKGLEDTIIATGDKVGLRDIDPVRSKGILFQKLDDVMDVVGTKDPAGRIRADMVEIRSLTGTLKQRWSPEVMLGYWLPLLGDRNKEFATPALEDVERVKANPAAPMEIRGQARTVEGLALRNQGDFAKAKDALTEAVKGDLAGPSWKPVAKEALAELSDPASSYLPRAEKLREQQRYDEAMAVVNEGIKAFPDKTGDLLALRSLIRLEKVAANTEKLTAETPGLKESLDDADAARKAGSEGAGQFAAARLAEELNQVPQAIALYRNALTALPPTHPSATKAKLAIARLRLQSVEAKPAPEPKPKAPDKIGRLLIPSLSSLVVGQLPSPEEEEAIKEAIKLADEVLARPDIEQHPLLKAQALSVKGQWTQALNTYVKGLKPHLSREHHEGLRKLVEGHPGLRQPDRLRIPHPMQGEKHYANGLTRFYERDYQNAEKEFKKAIENFGQDARYYFFLGLSRLAMGQPGSAEDFEQGARLENENRPTATAVNAALERIQGRPRKLINEARERAR